MSKEFETAIIKIEQIAKDVEYIKDSIENTNKELYGNGKPGLKTRLQSVEFVICIVKWLGITSAGAGLTAFIVHFIK